MRYKLQIAYDGRPFRGWQSQPGGDTVQDTIEEAISSIAQEPIRIHGSGRTDTGVHALGQVAHFDPPKNSLSEQDWRRALNAKLPGSIRINACQSVSERFHARFDAIGKQYRYRIARTSVMPPHQLGLAWHVHGDLEAESMAHAAAALTGKHDFSAFSANRGAGSEPKSPIRTINAIELVPSDDRNFLTLEYNGNGFLYKMVRMLTAAIIRVGQGRETVESIEHRLNSFGTDPGMKKSPGCAPAEGLYLVEVFYPSEGSKFL